ncbi:MAG: UDP-N-acetylglucosamine 2-epimerase, partial [Deltaproteobacteria bacterium]|nr:UDP-N-acetylglucosamine 2-epimerase [Deltaproteobacteria bacterium]
ERSERTSKFRGALPHKAFMVATVHRAENTDEPARLAAIVGAFGALARRLPLVVPLHPRTRAAMERAGLVAGPGVTLVDPVGPLDMAWLERHAALVLTDSGGVQKEAYFHRTPCVTMRTETEWVETVTAGWNRLADPGSAAAIVSAAGAALDGPPPSTTISEYGAGDAAGRIADLLEAAA